MRHEEYHQALKEVQEVFHNNLPETVDEGELEQIREKSCGVEKSDSE